MSLVEKRYAQALLDVSVGKDMLNAFQGELSDIVDLYNGNEDFRDLLLNPEIKADMKKAVARKMFQDEVHLELLNFIQLLIDKNRIRYLPEIRSEFDLLADQQKSVLTMQIISAIPLEDEQIDGLKEKYRLLYQAVSVKAEVALDKSILGGVIIKIGDKVIDGSVRGRLESLHKMIVHII